MAEAPDDLEILLTDVRKTISENERFLKKLADETTDADLMDDPETVAGEEDFEEL